MHYTKYIGFGVILLTLGVGSACATAEVLAVVSSKTPLSTLTRNQVADIFLGKTNRFPDGTPVMPINQTEGSPARDEFYSTIVSKSAAQIKAYWSKIIFTGRGQPPKEVENSSEVKKLVASNANAISYIEKSAIDGSVKAIQIAP